MTETWYNWQLINHLEVLSYFATLILSLLLISFIGFSITSFDLFIFVFINDFVFYKRSHQRFIDSNRRK